MQRAIRWVQVSAVMFLCGVFTAQCLAEPPDLYRSYRIITRSSTLEKTGGFAGLHVNLDLAGRFDLHTAYVPSPLAIYPPIYIPTAEFENVRIAAWNNHPAADPIHYSLDHFFDLEALHGTFRFGDPNLLSFRGVDAQGQPFKLTAVQRGRLLHLMGESEPQCCDFFQYRFDAFAHQVPYSDFNLDGMVDHTDMDKLLSNIGMQANATLEHGDADGDGDVDGDDFLRWQAEIGTTTGLSAFANDSFVEAGFDAAVVPEPAALVLGITAGLSIAGLLKRSRTGRRPVA